MSGGFNQIFGTTTNMPLTTGAMPIISPYHFTQSTNYLIRAASLYSLRNQIPFMPSQTSFMPWKLPDMEFFGQQNQNGHFHSAPLSHNDEPPRKHARLSCDSQCPICGELTVTQQELNEHFVEEGKQIEESFQSFKTKICNENQQDYVDYACENRYRILNDTKLHKSDRRQKKCIPYAKHYSSSTSIRSKTGEEIEDDDDLDVASSDQNDNGSCVSSPRHGEFDSVEKISDISPLSQKTNDCNCCQKPLEAFVSQKCRHFLCLDCYDESLQNAKPCPVCKLELTDKIAIDANEETKSTNL